MVCIAALLLLAPPAKVFPVGFADLDGVRPLPIKTLRQASLLREIRAGRAGNALRAIGKRPFVDGVTTILWLQALRETGSLREALDEKMERRFVPGDVPRAEVVAKSVARVMAKEIAPESDMAKALEKADPWRRYSIPIVEVPDDSVLAGAFLSVGFSTYEYREVRLVADRAHRLRPHDPWVDYWRAFAYAQGFSSKNDTLQSRPDVALRIGRSLVKRYPEVPQFWYALAAFADGREKKQARAAALRYLATNASRNRKVMQDLAERNR